MKNRAPSNQILSFLFTFSKTSALCTVHEDSGLLFQGLLPPPKFALLMIFMPVLPTDPWIFTEYCRNILHWSSDCCHNNFELQGDPVKCLSTLILFWTVVWTRSSNMLVDASAVNYIKLFFTGWQIPREKKFKIGNC